MNFNYILKFENAKFIYNKMNVIVLISKKEHTHVTNFWRKNENREHTLVIIVDTFY